MSGSARRPSQYNVPDQYNPAYQAARPGVRQYNLPYQNARRKIPVRRPSCVIAMHSGTTRREVSTGDGVARP
eukprot:3751242-Rhodomonas_salina.8